MNIYNKEQRIENEVQTSGKYSITGRLNWTSRSGIRFFGQLKPGLTHSRMIEREKFGEGKEQLMYSIPQRPANKVESLLWMGICLLVELHQWALLMM